MSDRLAELRATLANEMPVTQHLGIEVVGRREEGPLLRAPLASNRNHQGTAFGGSLNAIATLACWSAIWLALREAEAPGIVVIQDSTIRYLRPVTTDFTAVADLSALKIEQLMATIRRRGRGRITVTATVSDAAGPAVTFTGRYVVASNPSLPKDRPS
ncbi:MAG: YiiD C-terminal domain-containing protein [Gemmatimonadales bacterium]